TRTWRLYGERSGVRAESLRLAAVQTDPGACLLAATGTWDITAHQCADLMAAPGMLPTPGAHAGPGADRLSHRAEMAHQRMPHWRGGSCSMRTRLGVGASRGKEMVSARRRWLGLDPAACSSSSSLPRPPGSVGERSVVEALSTVAPTPWAPLATGA